MKGKLRLLLLCCCLVMGLAPAMTPTARAYSTGNDYPYHAAAGIYEDDGWNFYQGECTSFVTWCLRSRNNIEFWNYYRGVHWGTAGNWKAAAQGLGIPVDMNPAVGSVAWSAGTSEYPTGHVAWVSAINGDLVTIEEYNYGLVLINGEWYGNHSYNTRTNIDKTTFDGYIHIADMAAASLRNLGEDFYAYIRNTHTGQALENRSNNVQLAAASDTDPRQLWHFTHLGYNQYKITSLYDGRCLDTDGTAVRVMPYAATPNQFWCMYGTEEHTNSVLYYIAPPKLPESYKADGKVLDVAYGYEDNIPPGRNVQLALGWFGGSGDGFINGGPFHKAQTFQIVKIWRPIQSLLAYDAGGDFRARISYLNSCLQVPNASGDGAAGVETCSAVNAGDPRQTWHFVRQSDGAYRISSDYSGGYLDVEDSAAADGAKVCTRPRDDGAVTQRWYLVHSLGDSTFRIASAARFPDPVYSLDVPVSIADTPAADGMIMTVCSWHQNSNQQFTITRVDPPLSDAITTAAADPEGRAVSAEVRNRSAAILAGAVYGRSGQMLDAATAAVPAGGGESVLRFRTLPAGCTVKLMLLEENTRRPLCGAYRLSC